MGCVSERACKARAGGQGRGGGREVQPELWEWQAVSEPWRRGCHNLPSHSLPEQRQVLHNVLREPSVLNP